MTIAIHKGSILDCDVDVIVSPSNSFLRSTVGQNGGLAGVIERSALDDPSNPFRPGAFEEDCRRLPLIPTGSAALTCSGMLPFKGIIHAVGPIWGGGQFYENKLLFSAYTEALAIARQNDFESIAFPAISAGIFGVPIGVVAHQAVLAARCFYGIDVTFALMEDEHVEAFEARLAL